MLKSVCILPFLAVLTTSMVIYGPQPMNNPFMNPWADPSQSFSDMRELQDQRRSDLQSMRDQFISDQKSRMSDMRELYEQRMSDERSRAQQAFSDLRSNNWKTQHMTSGSWW
ncbi:uncharacterized protein [Argopecten irradians]|uniref:uncharacterized protein n=1 Tax=Argopecten irradians TaxID=31199 RepID=UPI0037208F2D